MGSIALTALGRARILNWPFENAFIHREGNVTLTRTYLLLALIATTACGPTSLPAINWQNHTTVRTCIVDPGAPAPKAMPLCTGYSRADEAVGAVTDVHYVTIQLERVYFRDLPEWTRDAEVSVDVAIKGLLPGGKEYRQVLDVVHVKKEAYLQLQNVSLNFPLKFENRTVSLRFSIRELDDVAAAKKWFKRGKDILAKVQTSPLSGGYLGALLVSEVVEDIADVIIDELASDDHVFSLKQVDFLPVANTSGTQEQLLFTEGRYIVVAVPPTDAYEMLASAFGTYPDPIDVAWLERNAAYRGGYLVYKDGLKNYVYTPYIAFNFAVLKRYADKNPVVVYFKKASRFMDMNQLKEAEAALALAGANFMSETGLSFTKKLEASSQRTLTGKGKRGLLEFGPDELLQSIEPVVDEMKKKPLIAMAKIMRDKSLSLNVDTGDKVGTAPAPAPDIPDVSLSAEDGIYTEKEYTFFMSFLEALTTRLTLMKSGAKPTPVQLVPVLDAHLAAKLNSQDIPLMNSECEVINRSVGKLWKELKAAYGIPGHVKVQAGDELAQYLNDLPDKKDVFKTLLRLQSEVDFVDKNCVGEKSKAY